jgi:hypothetical protein
MNPADPHKSDSTPVLCRSGFKAPWPRPTHCAHTILFAGDPFSGREATCARGCGAWFVWRNGRWQS